MDKRLHFAQWGPSGTRVKTSDANWRKPLKWDREAAAAGVRHRVFCSSLADVFEDWNGPIRDSNGLTLHHGSYWHSKDRYVANTVKIGRSLAGLADLRRDLFSLIDATPNLDWLLLTKRPENVVAMWPVKHDRIPIFPGMPGPLGQAQPCIVQRPKRHNVWLGTSISDQATAEKAIPELLKCRDLSPVLFLSAEPLLGPIDLMKVGNHDGTCANLFDGNCLYVGDIGGAEYAWSPRNFLNWVIIGGESGPNARPCNLEWVRLLVDQCQTAGVATFVKQMGSHLVTPNEVDDNWRVVLRDQKGGDPVEWPPNLRVRQFPIPF